VTYCRPHTGSSCLIGFIRSSQVDYNLPQRTPGLKCWLRRHLCVTPQNFMALTIKAVPENVGLARLAVAVFAANLPFTVAEVEEIKVAVSEAVTNAIVHAYPEGDGSVEVKVKIDDGELWIAVIDEGIGIHDIEQAR